MKKIIILGGSLNSSNRGVNALTRGTINMLYNCTKDIEVTLLSNSVLADIDNKVLIENDELMVKEIAYKNKKMILVLLVQYIKFLKRLILNDREEKILNIIKCTDLILDLSGGDSFSDIYGYKRFVENIIMKKISVMNNKPIILLPQTIGPFKNKAVSIIAKKIINKSLMTYSRDMLSYNIALNDIKVNKEKIEMVPDMAFWLKPRKNKEVFFEKEIYSYVGINISGLLLNGGYSNKNMFDFKSDYLELSKEIIKYFMKKSNLKLVLIPHVVPEDLEVEDDIIAAKKVVEELNLKNNNRIEIVEKRLKEDELKYIISNCDFFIGGRMHACIGAISSGVPTVPIAYSRKFVGIWDQMGMAKSVADPRKETIEEIIEKIELNYNSKEDIKSNLENQLKDIILEYNKLISKIESVMS